MALIIVFVSVSACLACCVLYVLIECVVTEKGVYYMNELFVYGICTVIFAFCAFQGWKKGFAYYVGRVVALIGSAILAFIAKAVLTNVIYINCFRSNLQYMLSSSLQPAIQEHVVNAKDYATTLMSAVPPFLAGIFKSHSNIVNTVVAQSNNTGADVVSLLMYRVVDPIMLAIIGSVVFIVVFLIAIICLRGVFGAISSLLRNLVGVGIVDAVAGLIMGMLMGSMYVLLFVFVLNILSFFTHWDLGVLSFYNLSHITFVK